MAEWQTAGKVRMTPKGVYDSTIAYNILDLVSNDDHTMYYMAKQDVPTGTSLTNTTYWEVIMDVSDIPDQINDINEYVRDISPIAKTGPSPLISISDAAPLEVDTALVHISPSQNLHGYAKPWPAGGGKNLMPGLEKGVGINQTTGEETVNANYAASDYIPVVLASSDSYYLSGLTDQLHVFVAAYNASKQFLGRTSGRNTTGFSITQSLFTYGTPSGTGDIAYLRVTQYKASTDTGTIDLVDDLQVQLEAGSAATTYEPYSNICPITGYTGATVRRTGKNLLNDTSRYVHTKTISFEGDTDSYPTFLRAGQYTLSVEFLNDVHYKAYIREENDSENTLLWGGTGSTAQATFTLSNDGFYRIWLYDSGGTSSDNVGHVQLEAGSVATAYEPYQGDTYTVDWEDDAGTVYGGILDLVAGTLTVDRAMVDMGTLTWDYNSTGDSSSGNIPYFYNTRINGMKDALANCDFEMFKFINYGRYAMREDDPVACHVNSTNPGIGVRWDAVTSLTDFVSAVTGSKFVYELATPVVYTLDSVTLTLLRGANVLWADCGDMSVDYRQDVATLLEQLLGNEESDLVANTNYAVDSFFTIGSKLYKATSAIATGETIIPGTNCIETNVADQLTYLYSQV